MADSKVSFPEKFDDSVLSKCKEICEKSVQSYKFAVQFRPALKNASAIISKFRQNKQGDLTAIDLEMAKETFIESKEKYIEHSDIIAEGMSYIHQAHTAFPNELIMLRLYTKYLAMLLASKEAQYPVEGYLLALAEGDFNYSKIELGLSEEEELRGITLEAKSSAAAKEYLQTKKRLECRFKKRQLTNKLRAGIPTSQIIKELTQLVIDDPDDIRTQIFLAKMFSDNYLRNKDLSVRARMKDGALHHCELAFSGLDTYLDLQQIKDHKKRDLLRAGFVKTISGIRLPLIKGH